MTGRIVTLGYNPHFFPSDPDERFPSILFNAPSAACGGPAEVPEVVTATSLSHLSFSTPAAAARDPERKCPMSPPVLRPDWTRCLAGAALAGTLAACAPAPLGAHYQPQRLATVPCPPGTGPRTRMESGGTTSVWSALRRLTNWFRGTCSGFRSSNQENNPTARFCPADSRAI